jgi:outer membrane protein OmpA-like peptidoglycan-associated protein
MNLKDSLLAIGVAVAIAGCAADDPNRRAKTGAAIGAVTGAVLGHQAHSEKGRYWGAVAGALAGAAVGNYMDNQQREFEAALAEEAGRHDLEIQRLQDESLKIDVSSEVSFDFARAELKPAFIPTLDKVAGLIQKYDRTVVHVIGHTDSIGSDAYNQRLSEQRAERVVQYFSSRGIPWQRLSTEGRGEREPRASNDTEAGRQLNRRVEILIKPVVEGQEQRAYEPR